MLEPDGVSWTRVRGTSRSFLVWPTSPTTTVSWHWKHQSSPTLYHHLSSYPHTPIHKTLPIRQTFSTQTVWARPDGLSKAEGQRNWSGLEGVLQIGVGSAKTPRTIVAIALVLMTKALLYSFQIPVQSSLCGVFCALWIFMKHILFIVALRTLLRSFRFSRRHLD